jgi:hypothetical protein
LTALDNANFQHAIDVMSYRQTKGWNDEKFWQLAKIAKNILENSFFANEYNYRTTK